MTIYPLYPLPSGELDDKTLDKQIKAITQVLFNVHHLATVPEDAATWGLPWAKYQKWALECLANYKRLVNTGLACCNEYVWRFSDFEWEDRIKKDQEGNYLYEYSQIVGTNELKEHELQPVIKWMRDNVPDLPLHPMIKKDIYASAETTTPFPLVMPKKYYVYETDYAGKIVNTDVIESYRNYYRAQLNKLKNTPIWTRREKPEWYSTD
jgi:uncharacterized protein involved in tolerance to divalent cations